jgi:hypothetical protein
MGQYLICLVSGKARRDSQLQQGRFIANILPVGEIGPEYGRVKLSSLALGFRPFSQLLGKSAVVGPRAFSERQPFLFCDSLQVGHHLFDVHIAAPEKVLKRKTFLRDLRMEGKGNPGDHDVVFFFQTINTPGDEITPGSYVI